MYLRIFLFYVEKQIGHFVMTLRNDIGIKYIVCDDFLKRHSILHKLTIRYTPQQNKVAKRKNRNLIDMVRCMLKKIN